METQDPANVLPWTEINFQGMVLKLYQHEDSDGASKHGELAFHGETVEETMEPLASSTSKSTGSSCIGISRSSQNYLQVNLSNFSGKLTLTPTQHHQHHHHQQQQQQQSEEGTSPSISSLLRKHYISFPPSPEHNGYVFDNNSASENDDESYCNINNNNTDYNHCSQRLRETTIMVHHKSTNELGGGGELDNGQVEDQSYLSSLLYEEEDPHMNIEGLKHSLQHDNEKNDKAEEEKLDEDEIVVLSSQLDFFSGNNGTTSNKIDLQVDILDNIHASSVTNTNDHHEIKNGMGSTVADSATSSITLHPQQQQDPERQQPQSLQTHPEVCTLLHGVCDGLENRIVRGKLVICEDDWYLSNNRFKYSPTGAQRFVDNVSEYFVGEGKTGNFLGYSCHTGMHNTSLKAAFQKAGHNFTVTTSVAASVDNFKKYDGVWLGGATVVNNQVLIDYVNAGGNVFLVGGTGVGGSSAEARSWNSFLKAFGFEFGELHNGSTGVLKIEGKHQILECVSGLYFWNGNEVKDIAPNEDPNKIFTTKFGGTVGVFNGSPPPTEVKIRITRSSMKRSGSPAPYNISIGNVSKEIHFCRIGTSYECTLSTPGGVDTPIRLEATGRDEPWNGSIIESVEVFRKGVWVKIGPENVWCEGTRPPKDEKLYLGYPYAAVQIFDD